jgi:hypothetical protein
LRPNLAERLDHLGRALRRGLLEFLLQQVYMQKQSR